MILVHYFVGGEDSLCDQLHGSLFDYFILQVIDECNKAEQWLQEKLQHQNSLPKNADPILWSNEIKRKSEALDMYCSHTLVSSLHKVLT